MSGGEEFYALFDGPLELDWESNGDELVDHLFAALGEIVVVVGHRYTRRDASDESPVAGHEFQANSAELSSTLLFVPTATGMHAFVKTATSGSVEKEVDPWRAAITEALGRMGAAPKDHDWWAVIGPEPGVIHSHVAVAGEVRVGPLRVHAATSAFVDAVEDRDHPSLSGASLRVTYPVVVEGTTTAYDWWAAAEHAAGDLNRLCALLSVAFDVPWRIRHTPDPGRFAGHLPKARFFEINDVADDNWQRSNAEVPAWCLDAWARVVQDEALSEALHAHHHGLMLEAAFPSHALIAYVGAVEGLGAKVEPLSRCDCCDSCPAQTGSARRFRKTLGLVLARPERDLLTKVYEYRSKTAHAGRLHGGEPLLGVMSAPRIFMPFPATAEFRHSVVTRMRAASRRVLTHFLNA